MKFLETVTFQRLDTAAFAHIVLAICKQNDDELENEKRYQETLNKTSYCWTV